jgi:hypothetical protein
VCLPQPRGEDKDKDEKEKRKREEGERKERRKKLKKNVGMAILTFYDINRIGEAVLPNVFQNGSTPPEKPLHQRSRSRSRFQRSRSPAKHALRCERIFYALPLSLYNQKLPTRRRLREFSSFLCVCGVEDDDDAASEVQQRARGRV